MDDNKKNPAMQGDQFKDLQDKIQNFEFFPVPQQEVDKYKTQRAALVLSKGLQLIAEERHEQIFKHEFSVGDPDNLEFYRNNELANAAIYILTLDEDYYPQSWGSAFRRKVKQKHERLTFDEYAIESAKIAGALLAAQNDFLLSRTGKRENPLAEFGRTAAAKENPHYPYEIGGKKFTEGNHVGGTWVNEKGETFYQEGTIVYYPETGLWVKDYMSEGITPLKLFYTLAHIQRSKGDPMEPADPPPFKSKPVA